MLDEVSTGVTALHNNQLVLARVCVHACSCVKQEEQHFKRLCNDITSFLLHYTKEELTKQTVTPEPTSPV